MSLEDLDNGNERPVNMDEEWEKLLDDSEAPRDEVPAAEPASTETPAAEPASAGTPASEQPAAPAAAPTPAGEGQGLAPSEAVAPAQVPSPPAPSLATAQPPSPAPGEQVSVAQLLELMRQQVAPQPPVTPAPSIEEQAKKRRDELVQKFALDPESATRFLTEPETVLPQLAARLYEEIEQSIRQQMMQAIPQTVTQYTLATKREEEARNQFYSAFPDLKAHEEAVLQVGKMYRTVNPKATPEQAVQGIGTLARQMLGITGANPTQGTAVVPASTPTPAPAPYRPAGTSVANSQSQLKPNSPWDAFVDEVGRYD